MMIGHAVDLGGTKHRGVVVILLWKHLENLVHRVWRIIVRRELEVGGRLGRRRIRRESRRGNRAR